ncbi:MFS transporter [Actinocatenispora sera]|uniref:MFS transporter n=1 Tax=Actinocatenispora sera TaxID=390989 RepID=A0A810LAB1_9ACTN|nr:MFS transporter [Actinocatenispora sera]BCJ32249.1 MFS transporter [Actinocatenispora sera]
MAQAPQTTADDRPVRYREVLALGEFRAVLGARLVSMLGDQVARVALSLLVFDRTRSAALAAGTFALSFLPALAGPVLAGLADRYPRRRVVVIADLLRGALLALMAVPNVPLPVLFALLVAAELIGAPANAAHGALLADILAGDRLVVGQGARSIVDQVSQIGGYAVGGVLTALLTAHGVLALNAASFILSALVLRLCLRPRPAPTEHADSSPSLFTSARRSARLVWSDPRLRTLIALVWMIGLPVAAEGLTVPYAAGRYPEPAAAGWLLAATPLGAVVGALLLGRCRPSVRRRLMAPMAAVAGLPLLVVAVRPSLAVACLVFGLSGVAASYMTVAPALYVARTPAAGRGQAIGLMSSGAIASQGVVTIVAGLAADQIGAAVAVGLAGAFTALVGAVLAVAWARADAGPDDPVAGQ